MKKLFIGILLFPLIIFAVGLVFVLAGKSFNFISSPKERPAAEENSGLVAEKGGAQTASTPAPKQILKPTIRYADTKYYNATGSNRNEIRASMTQAKKGTFLAGHDAATTAETHINFARRQLSDTCEAVMTQFNLIVTYTYPKWIPPQGVWPDVTAQWNSFIAALEVHEEGHAKIEVERASATLQELQRIPMQPTCEAFENIWQAKAGLLDQETKELQARYDRDTQSGKTQGASF